MTTPLLEIENLFAEFRSGKQAKTVLDGVSLTVQHNEIFGLVGESGSGKSTTARCVIGLLPPAGRMSGRIMFNDQDLAAMSTQSLRQVRGAQIGFVAQNPFDALNPVLSIGKQFENVILAHRKGTRRDVREDATELLASVGIPDPDRVLRGYAHELSGGMAQRVVLAIALSLDPQLLIADEPTTALDLTVQRQVLDLMRTIVESTNRSMLLVTHDLTVVATYCERVGVMYQGKILEVGDVESVFTRPQHPYTKALLDAAAGKGRLYGQTQTSMSAHERS
jgi:ABC-type dipeptide/oligopeptide/nickel transport system ATPase component